MLTFYQLDPYNTKVAHKASVTPALRGVCLLHLDEIQLTLIHDAVCIGPARDNPHNPRAANAPTIQFLSRQMVQMFGLLIFIV